MTWQETLALVLGGTGLLAGIIALATTILQNRNAHALLEKQRLADLERLQLQIRADKEERLRTEARGMLERHINGIESYCHHMTGILVAILDRENQRNIHDLSLASTQARIDALVAADVLDDRRIHEGIEAILVKTQEATAAMLKDPAKSMRLAESPASEAMQWIAVVQSLVTQTRVDIVRDPFGRLAELGFLGTRRPSRTRGDSGSRGA